MLDVSVSGIKRYQLVCCWVRSTLKKSPAELQPPQDNVKDCSRRGSRTQSSSWYVIHCDKKIKWCIFHLWLLCYDGMYSSLLKCKSIPNDFHFMMQCNGMRDNPVVTLTGPIDPPVNRDGYRQIGIVPPDKGRYIFAFGGQLQVSLPHSTFSLFK